MVNLGKESLKQFIESGAVLSMPQGKYLVGIDLGVPNHTDEAPCFFVQDFFGHPVCLQAKHTYELTKNELFEFLSPFEDKKLEAKFAEPSKDLFKQGFDFCKNEIQKNNIQKAVPYISKGKTGNLLPEHKILFLKNLLSHHSKDNYFYFYANKGIGFCGVTPELLFFKNAQGFQTMALAGTAAVDASDEDFFINEKENKEHGLVVSFIKSKLSQVAPVIEGGKSIKKVGKLRHLLTPLMMESVDISYERAVQLLHPTPALGGVPQGEAVAVLNKINELIPRGFFGAPFGYKNQSGDFLSVVLIRGLFWNNDEAKIYAGCGVVSESDFEKEWTEINLKLSSTEANLGLK